MVKARSAAEDLAKQQQKWEKKKEKLGRKGETARATTRQAERNDRQTHKQALLQDSREDKIQKAIDRRIRFTRMSAGGCLVAAYLGILAFGKTTDESGARGIASVTGPTTLSIVLAASLLTLMFATEAWGARLLREEQKRENASLIKGSLEQIQADKAREERTKERRAEQAKEVKARLERRAKEEAAAMDRAKEIARVLRKRREEREAQEATARKDAEQAAAKAEAGEKNEHGWTAKQEQELRDAVAKYPETWSHSRKARWEVIASEVDGGRDARVCEEAWTRLEAEKDARAAERAKVKPVKEAGGPSSFEDDDWLVGEGEEFGAVAGGAGGSDEEDEDEDEDVEEGEQERPRMAIEAEPEHRGTEIRLEGVKEMVGCATVQVELLHLQLTCAGCRDTTSLYLSGADEDAADAKTWCAGCSGLIAVHLRPTYLHASNPRLCYVDCVRCSVTDVLPSVLMSVCVDCGAENVHKQEFIRNRVQSGMCFKCHAKYAFGADSIRIEQITPCDQGWATSGGSGGSRSSAGAGDDPMDEIAEELRYLRKKAKSDPRQQLIQLGRPLPQMGACRHFKKSFKWYRFACCGRAFPCPECHIDSGCPAAALGAHASRMICGKCSMEQGYSPAKPCEKCGFAMVARGSSHWDGGEGTRSLAAMSTKDAKKFKGGAKQANSKIKTSSSKADRVGAKAKAKRDYEQKFGKG